MLVGRRGDVVCVAWFGSRAGDKDPAVGPSCWSGVACTPDIGRVAWNPSEKETQQGSECLQDSIEKRSGTHRAP